MRHVLALVAAIAFGWLVLAAVVAIVALLV